ncbi:MAG: hypothetical protein HYX59_14195 [Elusimicrobia bacterium]|nr:hypothetical protein [Elusimicrobiota bacterium]
MNKISPGRSAASRMIASERIVDEHIPKALAKVLAKNEAIAGLIGLGSNREIWFQSEVALELKRSLRGLDRGRTWRVSLESPGPKGAKRPAPVDLFIGGWNGSRPLDSEDNIWVEFKLVNEESFHSPSRFNAMTNAIEADLNKLNQLKGHKLLVVFLLARTSHIRAGKWDRIEPSRVIPRMWSKLIEHQRLQAFRKTAHDATTSVRLDVFVEPWEKFFGHHKASFGYGLFNSRSSDSGCLG